MDKRKFNGGNSTKSKGVDKRKNEYRNALDEAADTKDVVAVIKSVLKEAKSGDLQAAKIFLEYYLGKPKQTIDTNNTHTINDFDITKLYDTETQ